MESALPSLNPKGYPPSIDLETPRLRRSPWHLSVHRCSPNLQLAVNGLVRDGDVVHSKSAKAGKRGLFARVTSGGCGTDPGRSPREGRGAVRNDSVALRTSRYPAAPHRGLIAYLNGTRTRVAALKARSVAIRLQR